MGKGHVTSIKRTPENWERTLRDQEGHEKGTKPRGVVLGTSYGAKGHKIRTENGQKDTRKGQNPDP